MPKERRSSMCYIHIDTVFLLPKDKLSIRRINVFVYDILFFQEMKYMFYRRKRKLHFIAICLDDCCYI